MGKKWQAQDAGARFDELLEASRKEGPQVVVERGVETAVLVPIEEWRRLKGIKKTGFDVKAWLLAPEARTESLTPPRQNYWHRPPPTFE